MDIIQEARNFLHSSKPTNPTESYAENLISRLVDRLEWKLIESAPKDGTHILAYVPFGGGFITETYFKTERIQHANRTVEIEYWFIEGGEICPTHWMLLPLPPVGVK